MGPVLAERLALTFVDLDRRFAERYWDISAYITRYGYHAYARENVETCASILRDGPAPQ